MSRFSMRVLSSLVFTLGSILQSGQKLRVDTATLMNGHFVVLGASGSGKSRFIRHMIEQALAQGAGVTLLDVAGDTAEDALADIARRVIKSGRRDVLARTHYFEPGNPLTSFRFDPFRFIPAREVHPEFAENLYRAWLHATADRIGLLVQIKQGQIDFEQNARLQRVLTDVLVAVGTAVDDHGRHLPLSDALVLITVDHERHDEVYAKVEPFLDPAVRDDFRRLRNMKRVEDRLRETESTINRLRSLFSPILRSIFGVTGTEPVVDFRDLILRRQIALWNLRPQQGFSHDQKRSFAQLVIHMLLETMLALPREQRVPHVFIIEEAAEVINEEVLWALGAMRKTGLSLWILGQDLSSFRQEGKFDMAPKLLSQANIICFNQSWPDDTELLARVLFTGDLDFQPLVHEHDRPDGYDWHLVVEYCINQSAGSNWGQSDAAAQSFARGIQSSETDSLANSHTLTDGTSAASTRGTGRSTGTTRGSTQGTNQSPILKDHRVIERIPLASNGLNASTSEQQQESQSDVNGSSSSVADGEIRTRSRNKGVSETETATDTRTNSLGGSEQQGVSASLKHLPLARHRAEKQLTGRLVEGINDQLEERRQRIAVQETRHAIVKLQNHRRAFQIETPYMPDAFVNPEAQFRAIEWGKRETFALHPYNFVPDFRPDSEDRRLSEFLEERADSRPPLSTSLVPQSAGQIANPLL